MKWKSYIVASLVLLSCISASGQASNRQKVVAMLLDQNKLKPAESINPKVEIVSNSPVSSIMLTPAQGSVPRYALPKGNVFCRLEDYVQMHTPMKLNIGVGGQ